MPILPRLLSNVDAFYKDLDFLTGTVQQDTKKLFNFPERKAWVLAEIDPQEETVILHSLDPRNVNLDALNLEGACSQVLYYDSLKSPSESGREYTRSVLGSAIETSVMLGE